MSTAPPLQVRGSERIDFKRCQLKWYWHWKLGLTPRSKRFGALDLGTWVHDSLAAWYREPKRVPSRLAEHMEWVSKAAITTTINQDAPEEVIDGGLELAQLGLGMMAHYGRYYGRDDGIRIIGVEVPLEFTFEVDGVTVTHKLKPDAVIYRKGFEGVWILETKTAATIRSGHISIDDQARPYMSMAERCLQAAGYIKRREKVSGILYNYLRKAVPSDKPTNAQGQVLNKNGSVSARQPPPYFQRSPFAMSSRAKANVLLRLEREVTTLARNTLALRDGSLSWQDLGKTPHHSCPKYCDYFPICELHDEGADISAMRESLYRRENPYVYDDERQTTDERPSFELG